MRMTPIKSNDDTNLRRGSKSKEKQIKKKSRFAKNNVRDEFDNRLVNQSTMDLHLSLNETMQSVKGPTGFMEMSSGLLPAVRKDNPAFRISLDETAEFTKSAMFIRNQIFDKNDEWDFKQTSPDRYAQNPDNTTAIMSFSDDKWSAKKPPGGSYSPREITVTTERYDANNNCVKDGSMSFLFNEHTGLLCKNCFSSSCTHVDAVSNISRRHSETCEEERVEDEKMADRNVLEMNQFDSEIDESLQTLLDEINKKSANPLTMKDLFGLLKKKEAHELSKNIESPKSKESGEQECGLDQSKKEVTQDKVNVQSQTPLSIDSNVAIIRPESSKNYFYYDSDYDDASYLNACNLSKISFEKLDIASNIIHSNFDNTGPLTPPCMVSSPTESSDKAYIKNMQSVKRRASLRPPSDLEPVIETDEVQAQRSSDRSSDGVKGFQNFSQSTSCDLESSFEINNQTLDALEDESSLLNKREYADSSLRGLKKLAKEFQQPPTGDFDDVERASSVLSATAFEACLSPVYKMDQNFQQEKPTEKSAHEPTDSLFAAISPPNEQSKDAPMKSVEEKRKNSSTQTNSSEEQVNSAEQSNYYYTPSPDQILQDHLQEERRRCLNEEFFNVKSDDVISSDEEVVRINNPGHEKKKKTYVSIGTNTDFTPVSNEELVYDSQYKHIDVLSLFTPPDDPYSRLETGQEFRGLSADSDSNSWLSRNPSTLDSGVDSVLNIHSDRRSIPSSYHHRPIVSSSLGNHLNFVDRLSSTRDSNNNISHNGFFYINPSHRSWTNGRHVYDINTLMQSERPYRAAHIPHPPSQRQHSFAHAPRPPSSKPSRTCTTRHKTPRSAYIRALEEISPYQDLSTRPIISSAFSQPTAALAEKLQREKLRNQRYLQQRHKIVAQKMVKHRYDNPAYLTKPYRALKSSLLTCDSSGRVLPRIV